MPAIRPIGSIRRRKTQKPQGAPILLSAEATVQPGEFSTLNVEALRNNTASYIEINEIRFAAHLQAATTDLISVGQNFADLEFKIGGVKITNNPVSSGLLARAEGGPWTRGYQNNTMNDGVGRVRLARPILLAPGEIIEPTIYHRAAAPLPLNARMAFAGRAIAQRPVEKQWLPYFASFQKTVDLAGGAVVVASTEKDLVNATGRALYVERIAGRLLGFQSVQTDSGSTVQTATVYEQEIGDIYANTIVRMTDSRGFNYALNTPLPLICEMSRRSWEARFTLPDKAYIITETVIPNRPNPSAANYAVPYAQIGYAIIGYREI